MARPPSSSRRARCCPAMHRPPSWCSTSRPGSNPQVSSSFRFSATPSHCLASAGAAFFSVITGHFLARSALIFLNSSWPAGTSSSEKMASTGHSGSHSVQSMHSSGSMTRKFGPSWKQSTGHTSTQSVYLHLMHDSVTTKAIDPVLFLGSHPKIGGRYSASAETPLHFGDVMTLQARGAVLDEAAQGVLGARERELAPRDLVGRHQLHFQALVRDAELGCQHA